MTIMGVSGLVGCAGQAGVEDPTEESALTGNRYLALGDSVTFGYNPVSAANTPKNIAAFVGYPEDIGATGAREDNASCEGETSASFMDTSQPDNGCRAWRAAGNAMHVHYENAAESQLAFAQQYILHHTDVNKVSIMIGANDLLLYEANQLQTDEYNCAVQCAGDATCTNTCVQQHVGAVIQTIAGNTGKIIGALRANGYKGQIVLVSYYAPQYYDQTDLNFQAVYGLDSALLQVAQATGSAWASGFSAFASVASHFGYDSCAAGLLYRLSDGSCDKHPSALGQQVLMGAVSAATASVPSPAL
jgi:lysophospholipase L1-like esterase